jgi:hypothetical protein
MEVIHMHDSRLIEFLETSDGPFELSVVTRKNFRAQNATTMLTIAEWMHQAKQPPGKLCICCDEQFAGFTAKGIKPTAFLVLSPFVPTKPVKVLVSGLCQPCFATGNLKTKALLSWRKVIPDLSEIEGGRA